MLTKDQANVAADALIEANKSPPPKPKKDNFELYKYRVLGGIIGLLVAVVLSAVFDTTISYMLIFTVAGMFIGERIGSYQKNKKKDA